MSLILITILFAILKNMSSSESSELFEQLLASKKSLQEEEALKFLGGTTVLSQKEQQVNEIILKEKQKELFINYANQSTHLPSQHFFESRTLIEQTNIYKILRKLPKASLHTHLLAGVSVEFLMEKVLRQPHIFGCYQNDKFKLKFLQNSSQDLNCQWKPLEDHRKEHVGFDVWLEDQLKLTVKKPKETYTSSGAIWKKFKNIFSTLYDLISYRPVFEEYITELLQELYEDKVFYTELRGTFMPLYELNGTVLSTEKFFQIFIKTVEDFKRSHNNFVGVRYIHSIYRGVSLEVLEQGLEELLRLKSLFPDFIAGFDFVGYEEEGKTLLDYAPILLKFQGKLNFFFHAGETNWFGHTDDNILDAILLKTKRIGHAFSLAKHPHLMEMVKKEKIAVEICPISNQVLMLIEDLRNHPAGVLMANNVPVVICNDDPGIWDAVGLSYDFYEVFMGMTPSTVGLGFLKTLARNSIRFSEMSFTEKTNCNVIFERLWEDFLDYTLKNYL